MVFLHLSRQIHSIGHVRFENNVSKQTSSPIDCWKLLGKLFVIIYMYSPASSTWSSKLPNPQNYKWLFYDGPMLWTHLYAFWCSIFSGTLCTLSIWRWHCHSPPLITVQLRNQFLTKKSFFTNPVMKYPGQQRGTFHQLTHCFLIIKSAIFPFLRKFECVIGLIGSKITTSSPVLFLCPLPSFYVIYYEILENPDFN